jgi:NDP-sugar pyrophosphorylase family protein
MKHIDYGLAVFDAACFDTVPADRPWDLAAVFQAMLASDRLAAFEVADRFYEIGTPQGLEDMRRHIRTRATRG